MKKGTSEHVGVNQAAKGKREAFQAGRLVVGSTAGGAVSEAEGSR